MEKTATLNLRVSPERKRAAEDILKVLGIPMSVAIDMFLRQIALKRGIPFAVELPKSVNADSMTAEELKNKISHSYEQMQNKEYRVAEECFAGIREKYR